MMKTKMNCKPLPPNDFVFGCPTAANKTQETSKMPTNIFGRFREWILSNKCGNVCATKEVDYYGKAQS